MKPTVLRLSTSRLIRTTEKFVCGILASSTDRDEMLRSPML